MTVTVRSADLDGDGVPNNQDAFPTDPSECKDSDGDGIGDNAEAAAGGANSASDAPVLVSPVNGETVSRMPVLQAGAFHTPVTAGTHAMTRWQVFRDEDEVCVLDVQSNLALTRLTVPKLVLEEGTEYFWRAQFTDSTGKVSAWPAAGYFITEETGDDLNANGILDAQEVAARVDLDKDGVKDNKQPRYIKSVKMEGTTVRIGVSIKDCPTCLGVVADLIGRCPSVGLGCLRQTGQHAFCADQFQNCRGQSAGIRQLSNCISPKPHPRPANGINTTRSPIDGTTFRRMPALPPIAGPSRLL